MTAPALDDTDRAMLRLAGEHWRDGSARDRVIRDRFGCSPVRFWQRIAALIDTEAALAVEPVIVHRLQRVHAARGRRLGRVGAPR